MRMRFRTDGWHYADLKAQGWTWEKYAELYCDSSCETVASIKAEWDAISPAQPGDVWRIRWHKEGGEGPIAGYAICCIQCGQVHAWTTARNCSQKIKRSYIDSKTGQTVEYESCVHSGVGSCWNWSGSAEEGTLTASPSLMKITGPDQKCTFHGWLSNGQIA